MVRRRAIGASLAAILVFSSLLISNFTLLASADQRERLSLTADQESLFADTATVLAGTEGVGFLNALQEFLASNSPQCSTANQAIDSFEGSFSVSASQVGLTVRESAEASAGGTQNDNLSILSPFNGSLPGRINMDLRIEWHGKSSLGDVSYDKTENHQLNLPVRLVEMVSFCEGSMQDITSLLSSQAFPHCDPSSVGPPLDALAKALQAQAAARGLAFSIGFGIVRSAGCSVDLICWVSQPEAVGPEGTFTARVEQKGSVSIRVGG